MKLNYRFASSLALLVLAVNVVSTPAKAVEQLNILLPVLREKLTVQLKELASPAALWAGNSDLAELNRATNGLYASSLLQLLNSPLPIQKDFDSAMARQGEVLLRRLIELDLSQPNLLKTDPVLAGIKAAQAKNEQVSFCLLYTSDAADE